MAQPTSLQHTAQCLTVQVFFALFIWVSTAAASLPTSTRTLSTTWGLATWKSTTTEKFDTVSDTTLCTITAY